MASVDMRAKQIFLNVPIYPAKIPNRIPAFRAALGASFLEDAVLSGALARFLWICSRYVGRMTEAGGSNP